MVRSSVFVLVSLHEQEQYFPPDGTLVLHALAICSLAYDSLFGPFLYGLYSHIYNYKINLKVFKIKSAVFKYCISKLNF